ncbi:MAG: DUF1553 domain-containing protein, partial [Pirellulaceae bacterium]|nr:DUF1553 domain-containing protein [Pirellulaceae bacterium]
MNQQCIWRSLFSLAICFVFVGMIQAAEPLQYNRDVLPILAENCFACHGADSAARKADLRLDQRDVAIDIGAIVAGQPDDSEMINRVLTDDVELVMPPAELKKTLTADEKEILKRWISEGAQYEHHWSLIAPHQPEFPKVRKKSWVKNGIDRFVLARLQAEGLSPSTEALPAQLFRRVHLDVTGLPPATEDVAGFVAAYRGSKEKKDKVLGDWIDKLMQTSGWGEHRARYWLDAARYGDTHGLHFDNYREMWPYRDWVIRSFNANQPFNQFTVEQIAGDLLPKPTTDQLIATGFQRCNITTNEGGTIDEENLAFYAADRVQTIGWVYFGLTTNCAQCHDHKFDAITTKDYYSLAAFFRNTTQGPKDGNTKDGRGPVIKVPLEADRERMAALPAEITAAANFREARKLAAQAGFNKWLDVTEKETVPLELPTKGLVVNLPLNEGSGNTVTNQIVDAEPVKVTGNVTWVANGRTASAPVIKTGNTFDLGGLGDFEKDQSFSYGAWVRVATAKASSGIIARMDEQAVFRGWDLFVGGGEFSVHLIQEYPNNALKVSTTGAALKAGTWQHVFVTYDGSASPDGVKMFVDGEQRKLTVNTNTIKPDATIRTKTPLRIGQRSQTAVLEGGSIQDVRVYDRKLSVTEVRTIAEATLLQTIFATAQADRTKEQNQTLLNHYLNQHDPEYVKLQQVVLDLEQERTAIDARSPVTHVQVEKQGSDAMAYILMRGEYDKKGEQVSAATPASLHPFADDLPNNRMGLARWIVDPANPLTLRVTVNRFWQEIFGRGIVTTPEDFGVMGADPSHPELLDWLALEFRDSGWDVQKLFKLMLTSATYRQGVTLTPQKLELDRDNALLSRGPRFRMDAEMVRDYALAVSGLLSRKMYGPGTKPYQPTGIWDVVGLSVGDTRNYVQDKGENLYRRTVYHFWKRMAAPPNMVAFNAPSREYCAVSRERTNTPLQALITLNDPQFVEAARKLAELAL